jgi:hypothetical protein
MQQIAQDSIQQLPASSSLILCSAAGGCALLLFLSSSTLGILASTPLVKHPPALPPPSFKAAASHSLSDLARTPLPVNRRQSKHLAQVATVPEDELLLKW